MARKIGNKFRHLVRKKMMFHALSLPGGSANLNNEVDIFQRASVTVTYYMSNIGNVTMSGATKNQYSASEQGLGYIYQARFALLKLMQLPEETSLLIEKDDDLDFVDESGTKTLASLKHKATGDRLTDLSLDFWKSL